MMQGIVMGNDIVTSMRVNEDKWKKAKIRSIEEGITLTTFLDEALDLRLRDAGKMERLQAKGSKKEGDK
jgi:hypothetical protein